jgi:hypothetical protein
MPYTMHAITLEMIRQENLTGGRTFGFNLENSAYSTVQPNKIYHGDQNDLVLKLTNHTNESLKLFGGDLPATAIRQPDLNNDPTTLILDFGHVFSQPELDRMSIDKISIGEEGKPFQWKPFKDAGWKFKSFANENRLGLCPGSDLVLHKDQTVAFHFAGVSFTDQAFAKHSLYIYYFNLGGRFLANLGSFTITPLILSDPPGTRIAIGNNLTVDLTSADDSDPAKAWITSQAYLDANPDSWLPNELILKLAYTPESHEGSLDLTGAKFLLSFMAGDETSEGALTTPELINQINCDRADNWFVDTNDEELRHWTLTTNQPFKANSTAKFKFNNIHIGPKFVEGDAYAYLLFKNLPGFLDSWFVLRVVRKQAKPFIDFLTGPTTEIPYGTEIKLSWSSFAVPYLGLAYSTVYPAGIPSPVNKPVRGTATNEDQGKIGDKTTYILSGYNSKADFSSNKPIPGLQKELPVSVIHTPPTINSFTAAYSSTEALLQWNVTFGEMENWLNVEIQVENDGPLYRPEAKDKKSGKHTLKSSKGLFDEKTTFKLQVWNSKLTEVEHSKVINLGDGLELYRIKSFTATPDHPFVLGAAKATLQWEFSFNDPGEVRIEQDGVHIPVDESKRATGPVTVDNVTRDTALMIYARKKDGPEATVKADVKAESVEQFLFRQTVKSWDVTRDDRAICELPDWSGWGYYIWFIETIRFDPPNRQAEYVVEFGTNRTNVTIGCKSERGLKERDGHYYLSFKEELKYISSRRVGESDRVSWDGNVFRFNRDQERGTYRLTPVGEFEFLITATGLIGGPDWTRSQLSFGWPSYGGWWRCVPKNGRKTTTLEFNL